MRTTQRDQTGMMTFGGLVVDAASGSGLAQPGNVPFTYTRTATGNYTVRWGFGRAVVALVTPASNLYGIVTDATVNGQIVVGLALSSNGVFTNGHFQFQVTIVGSPR